MPALNSLPGISKAYLYKLPPPPSIEAAPLKKMDPWLMLEFIRVEALLRSETLQDLYLNRVIRPPGRSSGSTRSQRQREKTKEYKTEIFRRYGILWNVLKGAHHAWLKPGRKEYWMPRPLRPRHEAWRLWKKTGVLDLRELARDWTNRRSERVESAWFEWFSGKAPDRILLLQLDAGFPPETIIKGLRPLLRASHRTAKEQDLIFWVPAATVSGKKRTSEYRRPWSAYKNPPVRDLQTWLNYFKCYDLRTCQSLQYGEIAKTVFGRSGRQARDRAEKAVTRAAALIKDAERNRWPPSSIR